MGERNFEFDTEADAFYQRLGIKPDASQSAIEKAGKLAFKQYAEGDREKFFRLREARETLSDEQSREAYNTFIEKLGPKTGTDAYTKWESRGRSSEIAVFVRSYDQGEQTSGQDEQTADQNVWSQLEIEDPVITWANGKEPSAMNVSLWMKKGKRLYLNNIHQAGSVYLDLETGTFYTNNYDIVRDITFNVSKSGQELFVQSDQVSLKIDLIGDSSVQSLYETVDINNPEIVAANYEAADDVTVSLWEKEGKRLYLNDFHREGTVYIDLNTGQMWLKSYRSPADIYYDLNTGDNTLTVFHEDKKLEIALDTTGETTAKTTGRTNKRKQKNRERNEQKNRERNEQKNRERNEQKNRERTSPPVENTLHIESASHDSIDVYRVDSDRIAISNLHGYGRIDADSRTGEIEFYDGREVNEASCNVIGDGEKLRVQTGKKEVVVGFEKKSDDESGQDSNGESGQDSNDESESRVGNQHPTETSTDSQQDISDEAFLGGLLQLIALVPLYVFSFQAVVSVPTGGSVLWGAIGGVVCLLYLAVVIGYPVRTFGCHAIWGLVVVVFGGPILGAVLVLGGPLVLGVVIDAVRDRYVSGN